MIGFHCFEQHASLPDCTKENTMTYKIIALVIILILLLLDYALMVMAHEADEKAERMYRKWKETKGADDE